MEHKVFEEICALLEELSWSYEKDEEKFLARCTVQGEELPLPLNIMVEPGQKVVVFLCMLPFEIFPERRLDIALEVSRINCLLADGSFDFDITTGSLYFRVTAGYFDCDLSPDAHRYLLSCALQTADRYGGKLLALVRGEAWEVSQ